MSLVFTTTNNNLNLLSETIIPVTTNNGGIIYNGSHFLIGGNAVIYSSDSITWTSNPVDILGMTSIRNFAWNNPSNGIPKIQPLTIACGEGTNTLAYSPDGIYWKGLGKTIFNIRSNKALWNGVLWTAVGSGGYCIATSYDGVTWLGRYSDFMDEGYDIAWNGNLLIAVGSGNYKMATSVDGITWINNISISEIFTGVINSIQWTGKIWIATGSGTNTTAYSSDGYNWQPTNYRNLIITDASNVFSDAIIAQSVSASTITDTYLATFVSDNSMNYTSSTEWRSNTDLYTSSTGIYSGTNSTTYNTTLTASGEWLQLNTQTPLNIVYYHISWYIDVSASHFTIPKEWFLLGSTTENENWKLIDYFNYSVSTPPVNITSNKFVIKLQNIYSNKATYQYYRLVFPSIFPGGTETYVRVSELNLFYENANSNTIHRYIKPIITPTHVLYQTSIIPFSESSGKQIVYQVTDLYGNNVTNNTINNGSVYNSIINGSPNTPITSSCFDGENFIITPMSGNICYMKTEALNTNFNFDISVNTNIINRNISGNVYSSCYNGQRIVLGGTGGNVITYSPIITKNNTGHFANSLNANSLFTSVYSVSSNSGYGPIYIPNRIYFNNGDKLSIVAPKSYNKSITSSTISMNLNNYHPETNFSMPVKTVVYRIIGEIGEQGIDGVMGSYGDYGDTGCNGLFGVDGDFGNNGDVGAFGDIGFDGLEGLQGSVGPDGDDGFQGFDGFDGLLGTVGPTGPKEYGHVDEKLWETDLNKITTSANIFISSTNSPTIFDNVLNISGDLNTSNEISADHIQLNNNIVNNKFIIGKSNSQFNLHPYALLDISGNVYINNKLIINDPPPSNLYTCDVSGIARVNKIRINNFITNCVNAYNFTSDTIAIDFDKGNTFYIDVGNTLTSNFTCILNNYNFYENVNAAKIKLILDYSNASLDRFFCKFININGNIQLLRYTSGDPTALFSNSIATHIYIQNITILSSVGGAIWKVICDSLFYSS